MKTGDDTGVIPRMPGDAEKGGRVLVFPPADSAWPWYLYIVASCALAGLYFTHIAVAHPFSTGKPRAAYRRRIRRRRQ